MKGSTFRKIIGFTSLCLLLFVMASGTMGVKVAAISLKMQKVTRVADNGTRIEFQVLVFEDESTLYWKETEEGTVLYTNEEKGEGYEPSEWDPDPDRVGYDDFIMLGNEIYYIENGVRFSGFVPIFRTTSYAEDCVWIYFGEDGKVQGNVKAHGLFDVDSQGFFFYAGSQAAKDLKKARIDQAVAPAYSETFKKEMKAQGWSDKKIQEHRKEVRYIEEINYVDYKYDHMTDILNRVRSTEAGTRSSKPQTLSNYKVKGRWEETENGKLRYWADSVTHKHALTPNHTPIFSSEPYYVPVDKYDWVEKKLVSKQYLTNMSALIDNKYYVFDKNGYLITSKWVVYTDPFKTRGKLNDKNYENYRYLGKDGTPVTSTWVKKDGVKRHLNKDGFMDTNQWVVDGNRGYWVNSDGKQDLSRTNAEYNIAKKLTKYSKDHPTGSHGGVCETFANNLIKYLYGSSAKGKTYKYSWDKIKVGDTISFLNGGVAHIGIVMAKNENTLQLVESNHGGDKLIYWGAISFDKKFLDGKGDDWYKNFTYKTYY